MTTRLSPALPPAIAAALESRAHGLSRTDAAARATAISRIYREGGGSGAIRTPADALAYALARMPATYAAVAACLNALRAFDPEFAPNSLLDCGAGPGTATWAATRMFSFEAVTLLDANPALRDLALSLADEIAQPLRYDIGDIGDIGATLESAAPSDLVIASYMIGEIDQTARGALADALWAKTERVLLVVEPGTPAGYARIIELRARLIANGGHVIAPCPHDRACPLAAPDWCHFVQRLPRSRAHQHLKGAQLAYEDEKFSYVAMSRTPPGPRPARVLAQPVVSKAAVNAKLCTAEGVAIATAPRRDKPAYRRFKKLNWGDALP